MGGLMGNQLDLDSATATSMTSSKNAVTRYYSRKTSDILYKYGPGPRVHFHVGVFNGGQSLNTTVSQQEIKQRIVRSQEDMLDLAAQVWGTTGSPPSSLLDVGCGLGGGSIYWAQKFGASVTGLTNVSEHLSLIREFAAQAGVARRVTPYLADVHELPDMQQHDAAVAVESSGYMNRERLFSVMAQVLRPGGWFGIEEHFLRRMEWAGFIDRYYKTRLGTLAEYITAAKAAGFAVERDDDVTDRVTEFWVQSMAWSVMELDKAVCEGAVPISRERLMDSAVAHGRFFRAWREHAVETRLLLFRLQPQSIPAGTWRQKRGAAR
jgi:cyclopropane fatty-acyl-phospholipid synthase-like methyltransferase